MTTPAIATTALQEPVHVPFLPRADCRQVLVNSLGGVELGAYDERIVEWLSGWGPDTAVAIASLITRARGAAVAAVFTDGSTS